MTKARVAHVPLILVGALLSGCIVAPPPGGASEQPTPLPTLAALATPVPTATPTPGPTATSVPEVAVELTEELLTERVNAALVGRPLVETPFGTATVSHAAVRLADGNIGLTGEAQAGWVRLPIASSATVAVAAGRPVVRLGDLTVGEVLAPEPVRQGVEQVLQAEVDRAIARDNFHVRTIAVEQGTLTVRGR